MRRVAAVALAVAVLGAACAAEPQTATDSLRTQESIAPFVASSTISAPSTTAAPEVPAELATLLADYEWGEGPGVADLQLLLGVSADGDYGLATREAHSGLLRLIGITDYDFPLAPWESPPAPVSPASTRAPVPSQAPSISLECGDSVAGDWTSYRAGFAASVGWDNVAGFGSITFDYGDGRSYTSWTWEDAEVNAPWHRYPDPGSYLVVATITDGTGQSAAASCTWTWTWTWVSSTPSPFVSGGRTGAVCNDGWVSSATGSGACSWHGGVAYWLY
ncbi:MAG: hypothetical protein DHS20C19_03620 [Acidimicrobiales bacterium]|nr:MAG: hypothetical protein DHS20C19_03620 [Acidimicrobiales bacterium]